MRSISFSKNFRIIFFAALATSFSFSGFGQVNDTEKTISSKLEIFNIKYNPEQVYLHFDKPYYAAGDTVYFKAYLTMGQRHTLSRISGVLHVELINMQKHIDRSILLEVNNGVTYGDFALPDSIPAGKYEIRAYTNWMRNRGEKQFFSKIFAVGSALGTKIKSFAKTADPLSGKADLQFFPEGGNLIAGLKSKVAFKSVRSDGTGIDVKGDITDNTGKIITQFSSAHLGMGYCYLLPEAGKTYKADVTFADGSRDTVQLPFNAGEGITLSVNNDSVQKAAVKISANEAYFRQNKGKPYNLLIYSGGIATTVNCKLDSLSINLDLVKRRLHTGVAIVTLFSAKGEPLSERLFFVQNYDQLNLKVSSSKTTYAPRDKVEIRFNAKTRADSIATGHFSMSVIDEGKVQVDEGKETTILTNLLLTNNLKGDIEDPGYYFSGDSGEKTSNLDLVMLTHGYRAFEWKDVLTGTAANVVYQPEKALEINGIAQTRVGKPIGRRSISLMSLASRFLLTVQTDNEGRFGFKNLNFMDSTKFVIQAEDANNRTQLIYKTPDIPPVLNFNSAPGFNGDMTAYINNSIEQLDDYKKYGSPKGIMLQEVKIKDIRNKNNYHSSNLGGPGHADQVIHMDDIPVSTDLVTMLNGRLSGIVISRDGLATYLAAQPPSPMLIVVDGTPMGPNFDINSLTSQDVETVEALKFASAAIYGMRGGHGVLVFTTRNGKSINSKNMADGLLSVTPKGYYKARVFYSPKYENSNSDIKRKDFRSTIYWNPELTIDRHGNASAVFNNADSPGTYRVVVEGLDENGNIGRQVYRYEVK